MTLKHTKIKNRWGNVVIPATLMFRSTKFLVLDRFAVHCLSSRCHSRPSHPCKSIDAFAAETTNFMQMIFQSGNNKSAQVGQQNNENEPHEIGTVLVFFLKEKGEKKSMPKNHIVWKSNKSSTNSQHIWRFMLGSFEFVFITVLNNDTKQDPNLGSRSCPHCGTSFGNAASWRDGWGMVRDGKGHGSYWSNG